MENFIVCAVCADYFFKKYASVIIFASKCRCFHVEVAQMISLETGMESSDLEINT